MFVKAAAWRNAHRHRSNGRSCPRTMIGHAMSLRDRERSQNGARAPGTAPPIARAPGAFLSRLVTLDAQATPLKLRPRQCITLAAAHDDLLFAVQSGVVATRAAMAGSETGVI